MILRILTIFFILVSGNCYASLDYILNKVDSLSKQDLKEWKRILFYKKSLLSNEYGLIDDEKFYLHKDGKKEPLLEMKSTIKAFYQNDETSDNSAQCIFPRRLLWLKSKLDDPNTQIPYKNCKKLNDWLERIQGKGISIVFSSSYVNNPASMFGHTFLKIHRARHSLTDFGVNFSAKPNTTFLPLYALYGLIGVFPGYFSLLPYSVKTQEYAHFENRDLWEYEIDFNEYDTQMLLLSLWEVGENRINYFYLDENCSLILLYLLEAAKFDINFTNQFLLFVNPSDTLRVLKQKKNFIKNMVYRPSQLQKFYHSYEVLNSEQRKLFDDIISLDVKPHMLEENKENALILDAILEYIDLKEKIAGSKTPEKYEKLQDSILKKRSQIPMSKIINKDIEVPYNMQPDKGVPGSLIGTYYIMSPNISMQEIGLNFRPALHSIDSISLGYSKNLQINMGDTYVSFQPKTKELFLKKLSLIDILSIPEVRAPLWPISWSLWLGVEKTNRCLYVYSNESCNKGKFQLGIGSAFSLLNDLQSYILIHSGVDKFFGPELFLSLGADVSLIYSFRNTFLTHISYTQDFRKSLYKKTLYNEKTIKINATFSLMENIELQSYLEILLDAKMTFINVFVRYYFF